jgi:tRNA threonylcarbamoyladenosine biosynthesis protein TsaE
MVTSISKSPEETWALGREWAGRARAGWVIALSGDLGSGKTQLVKGLAAGLGIVERVHSPTFALLHEYRGAEWVLHHMDLYRIETREAVVRAGLEEYLFSPPGVCVVEWAERWFELGAETRRMRKDLRRVWIEVVGLTERQIRYDDTGA